MAVHVRYEGKFSATPVPGLEFFPGEEKELTDIDQESIEKLQKDSRFVVTDPSEIEFSSNPNPDLLPREEDDE